MAAAPLLPYPDGGGGAPPPPQGRRRRPSSPTLTEAAMILLHPKGGGSAPPPPRRRWRRPSPNPMAAVALHTNLHALSPSGCGGAGHAPWAGFGSGESRSGGGKARLMMARADPEAGRPDPVVLRRAAAADGLGGPGFFFF